MNNYPEWWDTTITIYNKYEDPQTNIITWYRTVIPNCFWKYAGDKVVVGQTVLESNTITCRIPKNEKYKDRHEWINLPYDQKSNYFTLGTKDLVFKGAVIDIMDEYQSGHRANDIIAKYKDLQGCMEIQYVINNTGKGRGQEHYHVKGI